MRQLMAAGAAAGVGFLMEKQSLVPAVQELWHTWEIHALILVSLSLQVFLFLFAGMRQRSSCWPVRIVLWLAYLSADSVAVLVLGHLAVRTREPGHQLMAFWAPFVLVHLGGQDTITAFSKQDNELWQRHLLNLVIQAAVAGYVVAKTSWPHGKLKAAVVLMFLCGAFKYAERTVMLYSADPVHGLRWQGNSILLRKLKGFKEQARGFLPRKMVNRGPGTREEAQKDMRETLSSMSKGRSSRPTRRLYWDAAALIPDIISVDAPLNQARNITVAAEGDLPGMLQEFGTGVDRYNAYEHVGAVLGHCYQYLYTKYPLRHVFVPTPSVKSLLFGALSSFFAPITLFPCVSTSVALALFVAAQKQHQLLDASRADIMVTYILLVGAIALDVSSVTVFVLSQLCFLLPAGVQDACCQKQWSEKLGQFNVISNAGMTPLCRFFDCNVHHIRVTKDDAAPIMKFILDTLLASGARKRWDIASTRGQLAIEKWRHQHPTPHSPRTTTTQLEKLEEAVSISDFPTSMLILHIATEICYKSRGNDDNPGRPEKESYLQKRNMSRKISNYITYLVFKCGVMLTTKSQLVHANANAEISKNPHRQLSLGEKDAAAVKLSERGPQDIQIEDEELEKQQQQDIQKQDSTGEIQIDLEEWPDNDDNAADKHLNKLKHIMQSLKSPVLPQAHEVAQELISINDKAARWDLIAAVWAEMLYYTAPRCGGGFHYEHLSTGGEFITFVLVLMYYLGPFLPPTDV